MSARSREEKDDVLAQCFVALASMSEKAIGPTQKRWAKERAENCLWALEIPEHRGYRDIFKARPIDSTGPTINLSAISTPTSQA